MNARFARLAVVGMALMLATFPSALVGQSRITSDVDATLLTIGDRVTLTVSVEHDAQGVVEWPDSSQFAPFELLEVRAAEPEAHAGRTTSTASFELAAFELGDLEVPSVEIRVRGPADDLETLRTDRFGVEVVSVGLDDGDIRDIRGPLAISMGALQVALWALGLVVLVAGAFAAFRKLRSRPTIPDPRPQPTRRSPHDIALGALARLEASSLLEKGEIKRFHVEVSEILRRYVEAGYGIAALEMTTLEILEGLERAGAPADFRTGLKTFLDRCDLVKFAKARPDAATSRELLGLGRQLVESSAASSAAQDDPRPQGTPLPQGTPPPQDAPPPQDTPPAQEGAEPGGDPQPAEDSQPVRDPQPGRDSPAGGDGPGIAGPTRRPEVAS